MGVARYIVRGKTFWQVDEWMKQADGRVVRFRKRKIPTREHAEMLAAKMKAEAFEGRFFDRAKVPTLSVAEAWQAYEPITKQNNDSWKSDVGRAKHLVRHLGTKRVVHLSLADVDKYREKRRGESTRKGTAPSPAQLDREIALLKRMISYKVECRELPRNPLAGVRLLNVPNVRRVVISEQQRDDLVSAADEDLKPILAFAYDHATRMGEVLNLRWSQVDLRRGTVTFNPADTKTEQGRVLFLTERGREVLQLQPRRLGSDVVFANSETGQPWAESTIRRKFLRACKAVGVEVEDPTKRLWFHDTRRSGVTNARKRGVPESVVMKISGHKTRSVFDRYNVVDDEDLKEAVRRIEAGRKAEVGREVDKVAPKEKGALKSPEPSARVASKN